MNPRHWPPGFWREAATIALAVLLLAPANLWRAEQRIAPTFNRLEGGFENDLPFRLGKGQIAGFDFAFTYGPLYQVVHGTGLAIAPGDAASLMRFHSLLEILLMAPILWALLAATRASFAWRAALLMAWCALSPDLLLGGIKPLGAMACVAASGWLAAAYEHGRKFSAVAIVLASASGPPLCSLYSFELGIVVGASNVLVAVMLVGIGIWTDQRKMRTSGAGILLGSGLAVALMLAPTLFSVRWRSYLANVLIIVRGYGDSMAVGATAKELSLLAIGAGSALGALVLIVREWRFAARTDGTWLVGVSSLVFALLWLRYGLTRSDLHHVGIALLPTLFATAVLLPAWLAARGSRLAIPSLIAWLGVWVVAGPSSVGEVVHLAVKRLTGPFSADIRSATVSINDPTLLEAKRLATELEGSHLHVWPFESIVNVLADRADVGLVPQSYVAMSSLSQAQIARLSEHPDLPILIFRDSYKIGDVENLSRTSEIFRYFLDFYELSGLPRDKFCLLRHSGGKRNWQRDPLPVRAATKLAKQPNLMVSLRDGPHEVRASDLLVLRLVVGKTSTFPVGKPGELSVTFKLSDGSQFVQPIVVPPDGEPHEILVSAVPIEAPLFMTHFNPRRAWISPERIESITLSWRQLDLLTRRPERIELIGVERLRRVDATSFTASIHAQSLPATWEEAFGDLPPRAQPRTTLSALR